MATVCGLAGEFNCTCTEASMCYENRQLSSELPAVSPAELLGYFRHVTSK